VICCDKTGTLTQNLMMVTELALDGRLLHVSGEGYQPRGSLTLDGTVLSPEAISRWTALRRLLECALICNNSRLESVQPRAGSDGPQYRVIGDATEGALACLAEKAGIRGTHL